MHEIITEWNILAPSRFYETKISNLYSNLKYEFGKGWLKLSQIGYTDGLKLVHIEILPNFGFYFRTFQ